MKVIRLEYELGEERDESTFEEDELIALNIGDDNYPTWDISEYKKDHFEGLLYPILKITSI